MKNSKPIKRKQVITFQIKKFLKKNQVVFTKNQKVKNRKKLEIIQQLAKKLKESKL